MPANLPAEQAAQAVAVVAFAKVPVEQERQNVWPLVEAKVPKAQSAQVELPETDWRKNVRRVKNRKTVQNTFSH